MSDNLVHACHHVTICEWHEFYVALIALIHIGDDRLRKNRELYSIICRVHVVFGVADDERLLTNHVFCCFDKSQKLSCRDFGDLVFLC